MHADLVVGLHLNLVAKVPLGHPLGPPGQARMGVTMARERRKDSSTEITSQRPGLDDQLEELVVQLPHGGPLVQDIDDIVLLPPG